MTNFFDTPRSDRLWTILFALAALFNFCIGAPLMLARSWAFGLAFLAHPATSGLAVDLWADFGFCVALIGLGYLIVAMDVHANRGMVWLGILAKLFDVVTLSWRTLTGVTRPLVLLPALVDAVFIAFFVAFLVSTRHAVTTPAPSR